ncbi:O-antigen ligase family protein [Paenibacillus abyssi]|uniref:O-antigen ligase family protein n=1 Tax=Paenibacillus abyssi TaxID=1340531 RepID=UPI00166E7165|nr:O-antigen ligase family protein [Paenibacillus abyssi]
MNIRLAYAALGVGVVLSYAVYRYGMYFDVSLYRLEIILYVLAISVILAIAVSGFVMPLNHLGKYRNVLLVTCAPFLISACYVIQFAGTPVSMLGSLEQALRWAAYGAFLMVLLFIGQIGQSYKGIEFGLHGAGVFIGWGSLAGWMGWSTFPDIVMYTGDEQLSSVGARLAGFFQYPNMLGAVLSAFLVWYWLRMLAAQTWRAFLFLMAQVIPVGLTLLLTESRGAWVALAIGWAAGLLLTGREGRKKWILYSGYTMAAAAALYRNTVGAGAGIAAVDRDMRAEGVTLFVLLAACFAGFAVLRFIMLKGGFDGVWRTSICGIACAAAFVTLLPASIQGRLGGGHYETAGARRLFYEDAWRLFKEAPWFGRGGDVWRLQFLRIQQQPYVGNEVHSGYLDMLLELGVIGFALFCIMLTMLLLRLWKLNREGLIPAVVLLSHAAIDFDMAYGFYWLLLFAFIAYFVTAPSFREPFAREPSEAFTLMLRGGALRSSRIAVSVLAATLAVVLLAAAVYAGVRLDGARQAREAASAAAGAARESALRAGLEANPYSTRIRLDLAPLAPPQERAELLSAGLRYEPQSALLLWELGRTYAELGDVPQAEELLREALRLDRFDKAKQTEAVQLLTRLALELRDAGRQADARLAAQAALSLYGAYEALDREVQAMVRLSNDRRFELTAAARTAAELSRKLLEQTDPSLIKPE